jgi:hypothetical protein
MSIKTIKAQIANKIGTKLAQRKMGKPDITKGVYANMTHLSENVKKRTEASETKALMQRVKNSNYDYNQMREAKRNTKVGKYSDGIGVGH